MDMSDPTSLIAWLETLTTAAGSGALATFLIGWLQARFPASDGDWWLVRLLHAPQLVRGLAIVLAAGIGTVAAYALAALGAWDPPPALTGAAAFLISQALHGALHLSPHLPPPPAPPAPAAEPAG